MTNIELISYYQNLLIIQYKALERAPKHIEALLKIEIIFELMDKVLKGFDTDTAIGIQLDYLAKIVGVNRIITDVVILRKYFGYSKYGETAPFYFEPYMEYGETPPYTNYRSYFESTENAFSLTDEELRLIIKLKITKNNGSASLKEIDDIIFNFFGQDATIVDNEDMTLTYNFLQSQERLVVIANSNELIPKPAGIRIIINFI